jgi:hypothetical protein
MDVDFFEQIKLFLPKYLSPSEKSQLYSELSKFPDNTNFYLTDDSLKDDLLQGDGWRGFVAIDFASGSRKFVSGIVLSNSCDISPENHRDIPVKILFCPLIELAKYQDMLKSIGKNPDQILSITSSIKKQQVTSMFFLPEHAGVIKESIILLDDIHAQPLASFVASERSSLFTLSQFGFYIFLLKLSIHFSRFQEGIKRFPLAA